MATNFIWERMAVWLFTKKTLVDANSLTNGLADSNIVGLAHHNGKWWIGGKYTGISIYDGNSFQNGQFPFALQSCFAFDDALDKVYIGAIHDIYIFLKFAANLFARTNLIVMRA